MMSIMNRCPTKRWLIFAVVGLMLVGCYTDNDGNTSTAIARNMITPIPATNTVLPQPTQTVLEPYPTPETQTVAPSHTSTPTNTPTQTYTPTSTEAPTSSPTVDLTPTTTLTRIPSASGEPVAGLPGTAPGTGQPLMIVDFNGCNNMTNLQTAMGAAFTPPPTPTPIPEPPPLRETYLDEPGHGCVVRLVFHTVAWSAFWIKLPQLDAHGFATLAFDMRAEEPIPQSLKVELKRFCAPGFSCGEMSVYAFGGLTTEWQTFAFSLAEFGSIGGTSPVTELRDLEELVFVFEYGRTGQDHGTVFLDNIRLVP